MIEIPTHPFIFSPGVWIGKGLLTFSMAEDRLEFTMKWTVFPIEEDKIAFEQIVEVLDFPDKMKNCFCMEEIKGGHFLLSMENHLVGKVYGKGVVSKNLIAWEFQEKGQEFQGFEIYELQPDGRYQVKAEFTAGEDLRTYVQGNIEKIG